MAYRIRILGALILAVAVPATAQTFGFSLGSAPQSCLAIGNASYRLDPGRADITVRIDATAPVLRIGLAETPDEADFIFVDGDTPPACQGASGVRTVRIDPAAIAPDLTIGFASGPAAADYRIYVRSRSLAPEAVAALFAAAHRPVRAVAIGSN